MTKLIQTLAASLRHAAWTGTPAQIGGGKYNREECAAALELYPDMLAEAVAPILARIDGAAPAPTAPAPVAAPGFAAHALDTLKDCEAWFANGGDVDGVFFDDATMLDRVRESLALATPTAQPAGAIGEAGPVTDWNGHAATIQAAQGYVSDPARWNPPSPAQVAHLLALSGISHGPIPAARRCYPEPIESEN